METEKGFIIGKLLYLMLAVFIIMVGILISRHTKEESVMYPFKVLGDTIEYYVAPTDTAKIEVKLSRLEELNTVIRKARLKNETKKAEDKAGEFKTKAEDIKKDIEETKQKGENVADLELELKAITGSDDCALSKTT